MTDQSVPDREAATEATAQQGFPPAAPAQPHGEAVAEPGSTDYERMLVERTADLPRLQAEYVNYKKRVDRDRDLARTRGVEAVAADLLPVLDSIEAARYHDELTAGASLIADQLERVAAKHGLVAFGAVGDPFDPMLHDALMHVEMPGYDVQTCAQIIQRGYRIGDRVVRPARVGVTDAMPAEPTEPEAPPATAGTEG